MSATSPAPPLHGVRIVDASTHLAGPFAGLMLADLGADVTKVEPRGGDPLRAYGGPRGSRGQLAASVNRNKRSVALNLRGEHDRNRFIELISTADVLVHNWRRAIEQRLGLTDDVLEMANPRLVRAVVTGFGPSGPRADEPAFDQVIQALSGLASYQGASTNGPQLVATYVADKTASMFVTQAVLAALIRRGSTGRGVRIDIPMMDAMSYWNFPDLFEGSIFTDHVGEDYPTTTTGAIIRCADGHLVIAPGSGEQIKRILELVGHTEWKHELVAIKGRREMIGRLVELLDPAFAIGTTKHWLDALSARGIPCAPVLNIEQHASDEHVVHAQTYSTYAHPTHGRVLAARHPARFAGLDSVPFVPFPDVGAGV